MVVLLIAGSGPTDRGGNSAALPGKNNSLQMLAEGLAASGMASLRFYKRGIAESRAAGPAEKDLRFDTYVDDAAAWAALPLRVDGRRPADAVLRGQLSGKLPPDLQEISERTLTALKSGKTVDDIPQSLAVLYRPSVQLYLISWFRYHPIAELEKLKIPVLIVQGTTDIQVAVDDARALATAKPDAKLEIIEGESCDEDRRCRQEQATGVLQRSHLADRPTAGGSDRHLRETQELS